MKNLPPSMATEGGEREVEYAHKIDMQTAHFVGFSLYDETLCIHFTTTEGEKTLLAVPIKQALYLAEAIPYVTNSRNFLDSCALHGLNRKPLNFG